MTFEDWWKNHDRSDGSPSDYVNQQQCWNAAIREAAEVARKYVLIQDLLHRDRVLTVDEKISHLICEDQPPIADERERT